MEKSKFEKHSKTRLYSGKGVGGFNESDQYFNDGSFVIGKSIQF